MKATIPATKSLMMFCLLLASVCMGSFPATALQIGEKAPEFTLSSTTGERISILNAIFANALDSRDHQGPAAPPLPSGLCGAGATTT